MFGWFRKKKKEQPAPHPIGIRGVPTPRHRPHPRHQAPQRGNVYDSSHYGDHNSFSNPSSPLHYGGTGLSDPIQRHESRESRFSDDTIRQTPTTRPSHEDRDSGRDDHSSPDSGGDSGGGDGGGD